MTFVEIIHTIYLLPTARKHILEVKSHLQKDTYNKLISTTITINNNMSIISIVKSYFWASRLINKCHCLPRSIALFQCLNAAGFYVKHKLGVNKTNSNIAAHAWVEYEGLPLNESKDLKQRFETLELRTNKNIHE